MICFGQWDVSRHDASRPKTTDLGGLAVFEVCFHQEKKILGLTTGHRKEIKVEQHQRELSAAQTQLHTGHRHGRRAQVGLVQSSR